MPDARQKLSRICWTTWSKSFGSTNGSRSACPNIACRTERHLPCTDDTQNLPGVRHDHRDEEGPVWLEVERLARKEPPPPPQNIAEWIVVSADPTRSPEMRSERLVTVTAAERDAALASGDVRPDDVLEAPRKRGEPDNAPPRFDLKLRIEDRPKIIAAVNQWIAGPWTEWSAAELPRRRTIALYQVLYKIFQLLEVGGAESPIELMWGIGIVHWQKDGKSCRSAVARTARRYRTGRQARRADPGSSDQRRCPVRSEAI